MNILVLGGDGYLGWPTAMYFSSRGCNVAVVDNYLRRRLCQEEDISPLADVPLLQSRISKWKEHSKNEIKFFIGDFTNWDFVEEVFVNFKPDAVIHYAEQPSAPYSMLNRRASCLTLSNNILVTANVVFAIKEYCSSSHLVKIGTMGEYGTPNIDIEEGWLNVDHKGRKERFLFPRQAGSLYHTTKIMDTDLLWFYVRTWGLKVTDLMQGPVYGLFTDEAGNNSDLFPFFNYDELFGTVINRFIVQAVAGVPLTVYGKGGQTRGYINIKDTLSCVELAVNNPPKAGAMSIYNQFTETFSVNQLAFMIKNVGDKLGLNVKIESVPNPRLEAEDHYYNPAHTGLLDLGLKPNLFTDDFIANLIEYVAQHKNNIRKDIIFRGVRWD